MNMNSLAALLSIALIAPAVSAGEISKAELKKALEANPDVLLDVLRSKKKEVFEMVSQAAQEEQMRRQKEEEEREKKEFEEAFKNPLKPVIPEASRIRGNKDAKLTLVEYSDFQCPYCTRGAKTVEELRKKLGDKLRFVYKHLPLPMHPQAGPAAQWFEAAAMQSPEKAWAFHDKMFENQKDLGVEFFKKTGKELGFDVKKLEADANSKAVADKVQADADEAHKFGFTGTPGFLLNGVPIRGAYPVDYFEMIIARLEGKK
jgi:protein-disulfide isomerase